MLNCAAFSRNDQSVNRPEYRDQSINLIQKGKI